MVLLAVMLQTMLKATWEMSTAAPVRPSSLVIRGGLAGVLDPFNSKLRRSLDSTTSAGKNVQMGRRAVRRKGGARRRAMASNWGGDMETGRRGYHKVGHYFYRC